jgi:Na+-driven multidrug efflux pump
VASESNGVPPERITTGRMGKDWTQGSIFKNLVSLGWPMAVTQTLTMLGPTVDMIWVGKLGPTAIAAVGVSGVIVQIAQGAMMGLSSGVRALIARSIGAKDTETANRTAQQGVVITAFYAIFIAIIGIFFSEEIISIIHPSPEVARIGAAYLRI